MIRFQNSSELARRLTESVQPNTIKVEGIGKDSCEQTVQTLIRRLHLIEIYSAICCQRCPLIKFQNASELARRLAESVWVSAVTVQMQGQIDVSKTTRTAQDKTTKIFRSNYCHYFRPPHFSDLNVCIFTLVKAFA